MKFLLLLILVSLCLAHPSGDRLMCYVLSWAIYRTGDGRFQASNVDPTLCTHVIYSSVGLNADASIRLSDDWQSTSIPEIQTLLGYKTTVPDFKVFISLGGPDQGLEIFSLVAADPTLRATFAQNVLQFIQTYELDGIEIDWRYPGVGTGSDPVNDPSNFIAFLASLHEVLSPQNYTLAATASGDYYNILTLYPDAKALTNVTDMVNIITRDYHGYWDNQTAHYAPLLDSANDPEPFFNVDGAMIRWRSNGANISKLNLGLGSYGRTFTLANPEGSPVLYEPVNGSGQLGPLTNTIGILGFNEICLLYPNYAMASKTEEYQGVPILVVGDQWIGYEGIMSLYVKTVYMTMNGMHGVTFYSLDTDDFLGNCGNATYPLLRIVNRFLGNIHGWS